MPNLPKFLLNTFEGKVSLPYFESYGCVLDPSKRVWSPPTILSTCDENPFGMGIFWSIWPPERLFLNSSQGSQDRESLGRTTQSLVNFKGPLEGILSYVVLSLSEISVYMRRYTSFLPKIVPRSQIFDSKFVATRNFYQFQISILWKICLFSFVLHFESRSYLKK